MYSLGDGHLGQGASVAVLSLYDSILANSLGTSEDLHTGSINSGNELSFGQNNLVMSASGNLSGPVVLSTADPRLGPLQNNGGPTLTMAPLAGSPVIDQGVSSLSATDARGLPRVYVFPGSTEPSGGDGSDLGAVEINPGTTDVSHVVAHRIRNRAAVALDAIWRRLEAG